MSEEAAVAVCTELVCHRNVQLLTGSLGQGGLNTDRMRASEDESIKSNKSPC